MIKELRTLHSAEPACQKRSDGDHLKFVVHCKVCKDTDEKLKFGFTLELNGIKSWAVADVPSMNPLDHRPAKEEKFETKHRLLDSSEQTDPELKAWDKGNYIPIDDYGNVLSEHEAIECLSEGQLKFFLQGSKLVGEFVLMKRGKRSWLLMKRHDEFALYNSYSIETMAV